MRSTFRGLEVSTRSLFAQQTALQTTGHNIANANTNGFTRQVVDLTASRPMEAVGLMRSNVPGQIGTGVEFEKITRVREKFLDHQFYEENKDLGSWTVRKDTLEKLEAVFNEPSDTGVRQVIEKFWNAWQVLSKEPENVTARAALKENALAMTNTFNHTSKQLSDLSRDLTENISVKVREANTMIGQVARLNAEIFRVEGLGNSANDLRDQRDLLADNLSNIINIKVSDSVSGYDIRMGNISLVNGIQVTNTLAMKPSDATVVLPSGVVAVEDVVGTGDLISGEVFGMIFSRDNIVPSYQFQINSMVKALVQGDMKVTLPSGTVLPPKLPAGTELNGVVYDGTEILTDSQRVLTQDTDIKLKGLNALHQIGYTLDNPPISGVPFFTLKEGTTTMNAANIQVNQDIVTKVSNISTSARVLTDANNQIIRDAVGNEQVVKGNNVIALTIAGLQNNTYSFDETDEGIPILTNGTFDEFYRAVIGQLGVQTQESTRQGTNQKLLVDQVDSRRQSVSGVSLDEEMSNMIKFQHAYNASARIMTAFDEMLDKVINNMGLVGR